MAGPNRVIPPLRADGDGTFDSRYPLTDTFLIEHNEDGTLKNAARPEDIPDEAAISAVVDTHPTIATHTTAIAANTTVIDGWRSAKHPTYGLPSSGDATAALQAWLNAATTEAVVLPTGTGTPPTTSYVFGGRQSVLPGREYTVTSELALPATIRADMSGAVLRGDTLAAGQYVLRTVTVGNMFQAYIKGMTISNAPNGMRLNNNNANAGMLVFEECNFDSISGTAVWLENMQSSMVVFRGCKFKNVRQVLDLDKCDFCIFEDCWVQPMGMDTTEQVIFDNRGNLILRDTALIPMPRVGTPDNVAWIANRYDAAVYDSGGRTGMVECTKVRFGGETGSMTAVNNYAAQRPTTEAVRSGVIIRGGDISTAHGTTFGATGTRKCAVRLFEAPNILEVTGATGMASIPLVDWATATPGTVNAAYGMTVTTRTDIVNGMHDAGYGDYLPSDLIRYANPTHRHIAFNASKILVNSQMRGAVLTNEGTAAATTITLRIPAAAIGMQATIANVQSGAGNITIERTGTDTIQGGSPNLSLAFGQSVTLRCTAPGYWMPV